MWVYNPAEVKMASPLGGFSGVLLADQATVTQTQAALSGFSFPINANESWALRAEVITLGVSGGGKFTLSGPAAPTLLSMTTTGLTSGITAYSTDTVTALDTVSGAYNTTAVTGIVSVRAIVTASANGTITLKFANVTSTNSFVAKAGSYFVATRLA